MIDDWNIQNNSVPNDVIMQSGGAILHSNGGAYLPMSVPIFSGTWLDPPVPPVTVQEDNLMKRFRLALESLVGASSREDLEATKKYLQTMSQSRSVEAELSAVVLLLETLEG